MLGSEWRRFGYEYETERESWSGQDGRKDEEERVADSEVAAAWLFASSVLPLTFIFSSQTQSLIARITNTVDLGSSLNSEYQPERRG